MNKFKRGDKVKLTSEAVYLLYDWELPDNWRKTLEIVGEVFDAWDENVTVVWPVGRADVYHHRHLQRTPLTITPLENWL